MLSIEQNQRVTQTCGNTPAGELLRRYWQPAALVDELAGDRPAVSVELFGEQLVLFRDEKGVYGLLGRHCPHRGADLCFGRLEDGGLRCPFHGWLFDTAGNVSNSPPSLRTVIFIPKLIIRLTLASNGMELFLHI